MEIVPAQAAAQCEIEPTDTVAVWGCGPVGQMAVRSAILQGAQQVVAIDRLAERLGMAEAGGATTIDFEKESVVERLNELTSGKGPDKCIDATAGLFGYTHLTGGYPGGQAEYVRVPFADTTHVARYRPALAAHAAVPQRAEALVRQGMETGHEPCPARREDRSTARPIGARRARVRPSPWPLRDAAPRRAAGPGGNPAQLSSFCSRCCLPSRWEQPSRVRLDSAISGTCCSWKPAAVPFLASRQDS
jgi:hypothetical protein